MNFTNDLIESLIKADKIAVLTGAGMSAESGIKTFRDPDGLWAKLNPEELASIEGFMRNPETVWNWYNERRKVIAMANPNEGHIALAKMETLYSNFTLITQNIDRLHQAAGSKNVLELHGNIVENHCLRCKKPYLEDIDINSKILPVCPLCGGKIRPSVVWFGEQLPQNTLFEAEKATEECQVFLSIGTSTEVYPAAALPYIAKNNGAVVIEINPRMTSFSNEASFVLNGTAATVLPELVKSIAGKKNK